MTDKLVDKLKHLPKSPGVYFHKNNSGEIIYIGKAANLRNRVRQYFQQSRVRDIKTDILVSEITDVDWTEVESESDALFLEAELVRRYLPKYNILLRDDKSLQYVRIDIKSDYPTVTVVRRPYDDKAEYFGPYINGLALKNALRFLRKAFPFAVSKPFNRGRASLHYHIGLDPGLEEGRTSLEDYRANLRKLMSYLRGNKAKLIGEIEKQMKIQAKKSNFEEAAKLRNQLFALKELSRQVRFSDQEIQDASRDQALVELAEILTLYDTPGQTGAVQKLKRIEGFDISHVQGTDNVASMVVFSSGVPEKTAYRKFKLRTPGNNDFEHMYEALSRRFSDQNVKKWGKPSLILIDGGKGQLEFALKARNDSGQGLIPMVGVAKKREKLIISVTDSVVNLDIEKMRKSCKKVGGYIAQSDKYLEILLPPTANALKLIQRIRDESHRFALSYHTYLRSARQTKSLLEEIPGVGPVTRKKLIKHFGSLKRVTLASEDELTELLGKKSAENLIKHLSSKSS